MDLKSSSIGLLAFILILIFITYQDSNTNTYIPPNYYSDLKIANWNMQIFGLSKANDAKLMNSYVDKIKQYDIIFLQEIKDETGTASRTLCNMLIDYNCKLSSRSGTTSSKEQYLVVYRKNISLVDFEDYNIENYTEQFERPPIKTIFQINYSSYISLNETNNTYYNITIWNIHIKPDNVTRELSNLQSIISYAPSTIILGDFNADCDYYKPENSTLFRGWNWIVKDDQDTTVGNTNCAYDRILMDNELFLRVTGSRIDTAITKEQSDHYIVSVDLTQDNKIV